MGTGAQAVRTDPYRAFNFLIRLVDSSGSPGDSTQPQQGSPAGGFSECSGIEMSLDVEEYKEGGNNGLILHFPTRVKWANLRLKRGMATADDLWLWHYGFVQGKVVRRDGVVTLQSIHFLSAGIFVDVPFDDLGIDDCAGIGCLLGLGIWRCGFSTLHYFNIFALIA